MGYQAVYEGGQTNVWHQSDLAGMVRGTLISGECFTAIGQTSGYVGSLEIRFRNSSGGYDRGWIRSGNDSNLLYYGVIENLSVNNLGNCRRFKLRRSLNVVTNSGSLIRSLPAGSYIFTKTGTCGQSNPANMQICAYRVAGSGTTYACTGFVTLSFTNGSMLRSNFCLSAE